MFEIQVQYNTGWETVETVYGGVRAKWLWAAARHRWRHLNLRLLKDGKRVR